MMGIITASARFESIILHGRVSGHGSLTLQMQGPGIFLPCVSTPVLQYQFSWRPGHVWGQNMLQSESCSQWPVPAEHHPLPSGSQAEDCAIPAGQVKAQAAPPLPPPAATAGVLVGAEVLVAGAAVGTKVNVARGAGVSRGGCVLVRAAAAVTVVVGVSTGGGVLLGADRTAAWAVIVCA
jgi:hypothetical protein